MSRAASRLVIVLLLLLAFAGLIYVTVCSWSTDMKQNLIAESWGVFVEVIALSALFTLFKDYQVNNKNYILLQKLAEKHRDIENFMEGVKGIGENEDEKYLLFMLWSDDQVTIVEEILKGPTPVILSAKINEYAREYESLLKLIRRFALEKGVDINKVIDDLNSQSLSFAKILNKSAGTYKWSGSTISKLKDYARNYTF